MIHRLEYNREEKKSQAVIQGRWCLIPLGGHEGKEGNRKHFMAEVLSELSLKDKVPTGTEGESICQAEK